MNKTPRSISHLRSLIQAVPTALLLVVTAGPVAAEETVLFFDDFNTGSLNRDHWIVIGPEFWVNNEVQAYRDSESTIRFLPEGTIEGANNGVLALTPVFEEAVTTPSGRKTDFISGRIESEGKFDFNRGTASARIKLPDAVGVWPAWWLLGNGAWPATGEIDIMEYVGEKDWIGVALHGPGYSGDTPLVNKYFFPEGDDVTDWHVYSAVWTEERIEFRVDERLIYRVTRPMVKPYGEWAFDNPKHLILNFALGGAYPYKTNGIDEPYNGLPEETVKAIKAGEVAMYVDWVRVTQP